MAPKKRNSGRDDLTIDGTAKLGNAQASEERSTANQPDRSHARRTTAPTPYGIKLNTYPPRNIRWNRPIYDPTCGNLFHLAYLVAIDRMPRRFENYGTWPNCTKRFPEHLWRCDSLRKDVPWDVCLAAGKVFELKRTQNLRLVRLDTSDMPDVAEQMKVVWMVGCVFLERLANNARRSPKERKEAVARAGYWMRLKNLRHGQATDRQTANITAVSDPEIISSCDDERRSTYGREDANVDFTPLPKTSKKRVRQPAECPVSKKIAPALPANPRFGASKRDRQSRPVISTESDGLASDSQPEDTDGDFIPLSKKRAIRPTAKAISKLKAPAVRPDIGSGTQKRARQSSSTSADTTVKQLKRGTSKSSKSLYTCSCEKDRHDPADLGCGFRLEVNWSHEEKDKLCFLAGNLGLKWATVGKILGREDSIRQYWIKGRCIRDAYDAGTFQRKPLWTIEDTRSVVNSHDDSVKWHFIGAALDPKRSELECQMQYRQWLLIRDHGLKKAETSETSRVSADLREITGSPSQRSASATANTGGKSGSGMITPPATQPTATNHNVGNDAWVGLMRRSSPSL